MLRLARAYEGITARAPWRALEPAELELTDDPTTPSPIERMERLTGASADGLGRPSPEDLTDDHAHYQQPTQPRTRRS
jgi:hypothetical protein